MLEHACHSGDVGSVLVEDTDRRLLGQVQGHHHDPVPIGLKRGDDHGGDETNVPPSMIGHAEPGPPLHRFAVRAAIFGILIAIALAFTFYPQRYRAAVTLTPTDPQSLGLERDARPTRRDQQCLWKSGRGRNSLARRAKRARRDLCHQRGASLHTTRPRTIGSNCTAGLKKRSPSARCAEASCSSRCKARTQTWDARSCKRSPMRRRSAWRTSAASKRLTSGRF